VNGYAMGYRVTALYAARSRSHGKKAPSRKNVDGPRRDQREGQERDR
jgi:hypothetical protein